MTKKILLQLLTVAFIFGISLESDAQIFKRKKKEAAKPMQKPKPKPKKGDIQPYSKVVTKEHKTDEGLFHVHSNDNKYLFEIPDSLLRREMLLPKQLVVLDLVVVKPTRKFYVGKETTSKFYLELFLMT